MTQTTWFVVEAVLVTVGKALAILFASGLFAVLLALISTSTDRPLPLWPDDDEDWTP